VYIFPKSEHQLQEQITEWSTACDDASAEWKSALGAFRSLAESPESTQDELYLAFSDYDAAILEYERVLIRYYAVLILSEHTEPTESGQLALMKETVPFDRPDGLSYSYEVLNMGAEEYMVHEGGIKLLIRDGITGQERLDAIDRMERYLPRYHDMMVGYVYYEMNEYLTCLSLYSDGLEDIQNCSTPFVM
jgi:tetratricopeptide (TPR) repeat protein